MKCPICGKRLKGYYCSDCEIDFKEAEEAGDTSEWSDPESEAGW